MDTKVQRVFITSTVQDLAPHRKAVKDALLQAGAFPAMIEEFSATDVPIADIVREQIDRANAVIVLVAYRYGSVDRQSGKGWIEYEYETALSQNKPVLIFMLDDSAAWPRIQMDKDLEKVDQFRQRLVAQHTVHFFTSVDDLKSSVFLAFTRLMDALKEEQVPEDEKLPGTREIRLIRLLLSSPGDVGAERERVARAVFRFNQQAVEDRGLFVKLVRWEDMAPQIGPSAQEVINKQIGGYHIFCGIMWNRFGTPTEIAASGTKEEFDAAVQLWENDRRPWITFYFCDRPANFTTPEQLDQKRMVVNFRASLQEKGLVRAFNEPQEFEELTVRDLNRITALPEFLEMLNSQRE